MFENFQNSNTRILLYIEYTGIRLNLRDIQYVF